jgi:hypothetical protein
MNGFWERVAIAFRCFFSILFHGEIPNDMVQKVPQTPAAQASVPGPKEMERPASEGLDRAVQMLALLQRDGRLIDFLAENISPYPDAQLGAAVRTIHEACRKVLEHYVKLPIRGVLRHKGWHVKEVNLPPLPHGSGRMVIAPAEVELS